MLSASPSEDDDLEDPDGPGSKKKEEKKKSGRKDRQHSKEAKAITTSEILVTIPELNKKDLIDFVESFGWFRMMTRQSHASG